MENIEVLLKKILADKRIVVVGIGNKLRNDDGFGPILITRLKGKRAIDLIDAGTAPESFLGPIINSKPDVVIILDVADLGSEAGSIDILNKNDILKIGFSTHDASPSMFIEFLENAINADIYMVAVQPKSLEFGEVLSKEVEEAINKLERIFYNV